jgi:tetratricopeptide (TPR) repeat protein
MSAETDQITDSEATPIILRPSLVMIAALLVYVLTLNHWVTFASLPLASQITGWNWHPGPLPWRPAPEYQPLTLLLTLPLRLLPVAWRSVGLNLLTAGCAALTLAILARSIRLLPYDRAKAQVAAEDKAGMSMGEAIALVHDRTREQRLRDGAEYSLLSVRAAFLPAAFAVLLLGAQLTFWQNATSGTGEMIDLLVFAFLILCLLEFRLSQKERWLSFFAFVYGVGVANNWALIGFFPCFLAALIWIKRLAFFNLRFFVRTTVLGACGLLLYALIPLLGVIHNDSNFLSLLHQKLAEQYHLMTRIPRYFLLIVSLPTLIPLLFAAINWPFPEGQFSVTDSIARMLFRALHILCLAVGVLMFFDLTLSPSPRARFGLGEVQGPGFLTFYYLAALSVGYFSGYVLVVFNRDVVPRFRQPTALLNAINKSVTGLLWAAAIGLPAILLFVNFHHIRDFNSRAVADFGMEMAEGLPAKPAVVVADDSARLYLAEGASQNAGQTNQYIFVDSASLPHGEYLRYLVDRYPAFRKELVSSDRFPEKTTDAQICLLLAHLSSHQSVYYLNPSFGGYCEQTSMMPNRLGQNLSPDPSNALSTFVLTPSEITKNQDYWHDLEKDSLANLPELANRSTDARRIADFYSQTLDCWGTHLQKAATELKLSQDLKDSMLNDANDQFTQAYRLNTNNVLALANQQFNARLRGVPFVGPQVDLSELTLRFYYQWDRVLSAFGPADVPELDIQIGRHFAEQGFYIQAAHEFERSLELAPGDPVGELSLAKIYIDLGLSDAALRVISDLHGRFTGNPLELVRVKTLAYVKKNDFTEADKLLTDELNQSPQNDTLIKMMAEFYRLMGYDVLRQATLDHQTETRADQAAGIWFNKALTAFDEHLKLLGGVPANAPEISSANLRKAELQMTTKNYEAAVSTLNAIIREDPKDPIPLLNRAISELKANRLDAAKTDFLAVEKMVPDPWRAVYYGLAQVAQKQNDTSDEIRYDELYLKYAPRNTPDFTNVMEQVQKLHGHGG